MDVQIRLAYGAVAVGLMMMVGVGSGQACRSVLTAGINIGRVGSLKQLSSVMI